MVPLLRTNGATPTRAAAALLSIRPSSGTEASKAQRRLHADPLDGFKQPLIAPQIDALADQFQHHPMHLLVFGTEHLKMSRDRLAEFDHPHCAEPAGLGMDHMFELVPAACEFRKCLADRIFRQFDVASLATADLVGGGGIGRKQLGIRGVGLGFDADQRPIGIKACRMDDLDGSCA